MHPGNACFQNQQMRSNYGAKKKRNKNLHKQMKNVQMSGASKHSSGGSCSWGLHALR